ncbi:hypothetical protein ABFB09_03915 [Dehalogenimonas sp. THU2]|uniref:hypothetical protein n=1 Tax=Dehalogenimonas sp. THU2 TaxID=3151121 RepID=UPI0032187824
MAREAVPLALTLYNRDGLLLVTTPENPENTLRHLLGRLTDIRIVPAVKRRLQPAEVASLRRNINLLERFASPESQGLLALLDFENAAIGTASGSHPITAALASLSSRLSPPALIIIASAPGDDAEATTWALDPWRRKGYEVLFMDSNSHLKHT